MHHVYNQLREHLGRHPAGFPKTASGHELRMLKKLFTKEEAEIALHLSLRRQTIDQLSEKTGMSRDELAKSLAVMADKGLILEDKRKGEPRYCLVAFFPGIYEFQVQNLDEQLAHAFEHMYPDLVKEVAGGKTPWMRVLPAEQSIVDMKVLPYQKVTELISHVETVAITDCICRKEQKLLGHGHGCAHPLDSICLYFTPWAEYLIDKGAAKKGTMQDALKVVERGENSGLVHIGLNATDDILGLCQCCSCCCGLMRALTEFKMPSVAKSDFYSEINIDVCTGCGSCITVCPVKAISMNKKDEKAVVNTIECIGCGLCAVECAPGAISMVLKKKNDIILPPHDSKELWLAIAEEKKKTYFFQPER